MKIKSSTSIGLALCLVGSICTLRAQTTNTTQQILQMHTFREGLVLTGDQMPSEAENQELLEVLSHLNEPWWTSGVEQFLRDHSDSAWAISLRHDYASFCRRTGRTTKALEQWAAAWAQAKNDVSPQGQKLAGTILANWMDLLASLGRLEELKALVVVGDQWHFVDARDRDTFQGAKNSFYLMQEHPGIAYRCGTFALKAVGLQLQPDNHALENLVELPSPTNGFSMASLLDLAKQYHLNMVAVRRSQGQDLIVPSVVHWRQNHYAAILERENDSYLVNDPTFGQPKWMPAEVINEEASGEFLIPVAAQTTGWALLARNETEVIHGMGLPNNINDGKDKGCKPGQPCPPCQGMPVAWVSEPYINLWLADEPLSYLTSRGEPFTFRITYKQRDSRPPTDWLVQNAGWNNSWSSYVHLTSIGICNNMGGTGCMPSLGTCSAVVYLPNGGEVDFAHGQSYDAETQLSLQQQAPAVLLAGADYGKNGLRLIHADGSQDIYGLGITIPVPYGDYSEAEFLWTRHIAANGDTTWFQYGTSPTVLKFVLDPDGRTNELTYSGASYNLLSSVTNGYGQSAHFKYDASGNLTNLVDAQGLSSSITYETNGYPNRLITPYGTNQFVVFVNSTVADTNNGQGNFGGHNLIDRAVQITDPTGATSLHLYRYDCSTFMSTTFSSGDVPTGTPLGTLDDGNGSSTNTLAAVCYRNSFYWGPRQYASLSTTNMSSFTANDFIRGRMRHWLQDSNDLNLSGYVSVERDPSPDGSIEGLKTFYDYQGKVFPHRSGTNALPSVTAWRLPGGETHYEYKLFDYFGNVTQDITSCTLPDGSLGTRTNQFIYADNTYVYVFGGWDGSNLTPAYSSSYTIPNLLAKIIGADGNPVWSYGGFDTVTWTNFFYQGSLTNATTQTAFRVLPDYATNGLGQVATATYTAGGNAVAFVDMIKFSGMLTNTHYGTPFATSFPGYSKVTSVTSVAGLTTTNIYNTNGFLAQTIDQPIGRTNAFGYTTDGLVGAFTNALGLNVSLTWDNLLRLTGVHYPDGTAESVTYSKLDPYLVYDRLGNATVYLYDGARRLNSIIYAYNSSFESFDWCGCGALTGTTDALYHHTTFNYNNAGSMTNISFTNGIALNYQHNLAGQVTNVFDGSGRSLQVAYNNQGRVTAVSNIFGRSWSATYDLLDRPVVVTDANGVTVTNGFDALNRVVKRTWTDGVSESYGYNAAGLMAYTNRDHQITLYGRDAAGRLTTVTNANTEVTQFAYNPADELISLTNGLNHTTTWQYNEFGWVTNKTDGLGRTAFRLAYNANGWVTNRWTPEKGDTGYTYDGLGNLLAIHYPLTTITYVYDLINELTNLTDQTGTTQFRYTPTGQLASESNAWANVSYAYSQDQRTNLTLGSWTQGYDYDASWRMTNVVSPAGTFNYSYGFQPTSRLPTGISLPNGAGIVNIYDTLARLKETDLTNQWGHILDGYTSGFDSLGLRTNIVRNLGLTTSTATAGFDNIGQLTSWNANEAGGILRQNEQLGFGYDAAHNLHTRTNRYLTQTFTTDAANELTGVARLGTFTASGAIPAPANNVTVNSSLAQVYGDYTFARTNLPLVSGNNSFTNIAQNVYGLKTTNIVTVNLPSSVTLNYDSNGNLTNDGTLTFGYDAENQLTNVMVPGSWKSDFSYDGLNRRRIERDYSWSGSTWTPTNEVHYVYDGYVVIQERDGSNNPLVTYTRGLDLSSSLQGAGGIGGLLARTDATSTSFYHAGGAGNITALMNGSNVVARYIYNPFGKLVGKWGPLADLNVMQFSSMPHHNLSGLSLYPLRAYEPGLQRWLNQDPIEENGGINLYGLVFNNPINDVDPLGLSPDSWPFIGPIISNNELNSFAQRFSDKNGNSFQNYDDAFRYFNPNKPNNIATVGDVSGVQAGAELTKAGANFVLGVETSVTPTGTGTKCLTGLAAKETTAATAPLKNLSGSVDEAANAARSAAYRPDTVSIHALGRMNTRAVSYESIQEAVSKGIRTFDSATGKATYTLSAADSSTGRAVFVVRNEATGNIISVIDKGSK